jgi:hypothetical protein
MKRLVRRACLVLSAALLGGCALEPPAPWEKAMLAEPSMNMGGDPLEQRFDDHISSSKQAASGGYGVGGGGCGCN